MADLSDFLGHILEEVTRARVAGDIETIKTARTYLNAEDGLLRNFPVPRMRLPNLEITAPVVISLVPDGFHEQTDATELNKIFTNEIQDVLARKKITIATDEIIQLIKADTSLARGYVLKTSSQQLSKRVADHLQAAKANPRMVHAEVVSEIQRQLDTAIAALPRKPAGIGIDATTSTVKEFNPPAGQGANVVYIKMAITEDAMEIELEPVAKPTNENDPPPPIIKRLIPE